MQLNVPESLIGLAEEGKHKKLGDVASRLRSLSSTERLTPPRGQVILILVLPISASGKIIELEKDVGWINCTAARIPHHPLTLLRARERPTPRFAASKSSINRRVLRHRLIFWSPRFLLLLLLELQWQNFL